MVPSFQHFSRKFTFILLSFFSLTACNPLIHTSTHTGVTAKSTPGKARTGANGLNTTTNTAAAKPIHKALSEKGWVSQLKPTAHNYHLKNLQNASVAAVEVSICCYFVYCTDIDF